MNDLRIVPNEGNKGSKCELVPILGNLADGAKLSPYCRCLGGTGSVAVGKNLMLRPKMLRQPSFKA